MTQEKLDKEVGSKEQEILKPAKVKIVNVELAEITKGKLTAEKVVCLVKHPDREDQIHISAVRYLKKDKVRTSGLWFKEDDDGNLQKGTALSEFLNFIDADTIRQLEEKEVETIADDDGYLCFKAY